MVKKPPLAREGRTGYRVPPNGTLPKRAASGGPIRGDETDLVRNRIREVMGDQPQRAFARACAISEGALRDYLRGTKLPGLVALVGIANAGEVSVDWLATGRLPRTRAEVKALQNDRGLPVVGPVNHEALAAILVGIMKAKPNAPAARIAALAAQFYAQTVAEGGIPVPGEHPKHPKVA